MNKKPVFKKIYLEITNSCNLNCSFCLKSKRTKTMLSFDKFKFILNDIKDYTNYLYLHVLGEPLIHPEINKFIDYASTNFNINITSNGYLINNLKANNIRQINISLHSYNPLLNKSLRDYLSDIFDYEKKYSNNVYINYRLWTKNKFSKDIINKLEENYNIKIDLNKNNIKLKENVFLNFDSEFKWPQDNNEENVNYQGYCHALTDHIAILSNGEVTACCLDGDGKLSFGNIFKKSLKDVISSDKFTNMKQELMDGKRTSDLCKKCNFLNRE